MAARDAMQLAGGDPKAAGPWYRKLLPSAKMPTHPKRYFTTWYRRLGGALASAYRAVVHRGRPKKIPDYAMLAIAKGPLQRPYYSNGQPIFPLSAAEVCARQCMATPLAARAAPPGPRPSPLTQPWPASPPAGC